MIRESKFLLLIIFAGILQVTVLDCVKIFGIKPDLILIGVVWGSAAFEFRWAFLLSLCAGVFRDCFGTSLFGYHTLLYALWCFLLIKLSRKISLEDKFIRIALVAIFSFLDTLFVGIVMAYSGKTIPLGIFLRIVTLQPLYTTFAVWGLLRARASLIE